MAKMGTGRGGYGSDPSEAHAQVPHGGDVRRKPHPPSVGNETKADMRGAQLGQPTDKSPLHGAVKELHDQHPISYSDHGPHHGTKHHVRHEPLHGMHTKGSHGRK